MNKTNLLSVLLPLLVACGGTKQAGDSKTAADEDGTESSASAKTDTPESTEKAAPASDKPAPGSQDEAATGAPKKDECSAFDISNLEAVLLKSSCEVPNPKADDKPIEAKNVEVKVAASPSKVAPGGHVDLIVSFTNKTKDPLPLLFTIDPMPRFEVQAYDAKGNRVDMPKNQPPPLPAGVAARVPGEPKTARIVLAANGTARMSLGWEANHTKWAPEKLKGTPPEKGYPRTAAGALPKGKYSIKVVTPLIGVFEGIDHEVSQPRASLDIGK
jgi:hypothetical protein